MQPAGDSSPSGVRLSELMGTLSLSADLGFGQPMEHTLRSCLIAVRLGRRIGLSEQDLATTYWVTLFGMVCTSESAPLVRMFGDEITFRAGFYELGPSPLAQVTYLVGRAGADGGPAHRAKTAAGLLLTGGRQFVSSLRSHTEVTAEVAGRVGLGPEVSEALRHTFAQWNGKGVPPGVRGDQVPVAAQLLQLADSAEVKHRMAGLPAALDAVQAQAGKGLDPGLVEAFRDHAPELFDSLGESTPWEELIHAEPLARPELSHDELDAVLEVIADVADLKSPWFGGHSRGVAQLAADAAASRGLPAADVRTTRRAGLLHDLGRTGVPNTVWDKQGPLTEAETERARLTPYLTERMLRRPPALADLATIASAAYERMDGSGYPRRATGSSIPALARYLAAADCYHAMREDRPYRPALTAAQAAAQVRDAIRSGALDADAGEAVLQVAGHASRPRAQAPAGLTPRETEVLVLVARGATTRQAGKLLGISPKTAGNHLERAYAKAGVSSRSAATLYAMQHGLLQTLEPLGT